MHISMYTASVPVYVRFLKNARSWIDKARVWAKEKGIPESELCEARLAPDMFTFARQIQVVSDHAKAGAARLTGVENPRFEDTEKTFDELQARIDKTLAFLETVPAEKFAGAEDREIVFPSRHGERRFLGHAFLFEYNLPNFFFHATTAYDILRHKGLDLGKPDFLTGVKQT